MFHRLSSACVAVLLIAVTASGCSTVDLKAAVQITDVSSGYFDAGLTPAGLNKLVPSLTFSVRNGADQKLTSIDMVAMFWQAGSDAEMDELVVKVIGGAGLAPGASTEPVVLRSGVGYTLEQPRAELFTHGGFVDVTAKLFVKRGGRIVPVGEYKIDRRLLLGAPSASAVR
jgi:hypothetical protein